MKPFNTIQKMGAIPIFIILLMSGAVRAQANTQHEKVESMRIAFITQRLNLTSTEAKSFWPVYNSYRHDLSTLRRNFYPMDDGTDPHLDADQQLEFDQKKLDLRKRYKPEFEQVLGKEKLNKLLGAEEDFKRMLVEVVRNRRVQNGNVK